MVVDKGGGKRVTLAERLAQMRAKKKYTQQRVADHLGISRGAYANYEVGSREPDADTLSRLAELYEVSTDWLIKGDSRGAWISHGVGSGKTKAFIDALLLGRAADQNPLGIDLSDEQLDILRDVMSDPDLMLMFRDFAKSTDEERRMLLDVWGAIRKRRND